jgi:predicted O-methyltransferase YrrM
VQPNGRIPAITRFIERSTMFHDIPAEMADRMGYLESMDAEQRRRADVPRPERLSQIPPDTGRLLALLAAGAPAGPCVEIGTSAGYSTLWLTLACRATGRTITTYELLESKAALARETFRIAGVESMVDLVVGDVRDTRQGGKPIGFCFLDAAKDVYHDSYDIVLPDIVSGGVLVCDNISSHQSVLEPFVDSVLSDRRVDATVLLVGKGLLFCRKL